MKRMYLYLIMLLLCLHMTGCSQTGTSSGQWKMAQEGYYTGAFSETGYYYSLDGIAYYVDFSTGINICLCPKVGCPHDDEIICEGALRNVVGRDMYYWNNHLYYIRRDGYGQHLYRRNSDGTGEVAVATLCHQFLEEDRETFLNVGRSVLVDGYFYYTVEISRPEMSENVMTSLEYERTVLMQLNVNTGEDRVLLDSMDDGYAAKLIAAKGTDVLYTYCRVIEQDEYETTEEYFQIRDKEKVKLMRLDTKTGKSKELFEKTGAEIEATVGVYNGKLYYYQYVSQHELRYFTYDINTGKEQIFYEGMINNLIAGRYQLSKKDQSDYEVWILQDLQEGKELPCEAFYEGTQIFLVENENDTGIILRHRAVNMSGGEIREQTWSYVPMDTLADGLQRSDCIDFYVYHNK